MVSTVTVPPSRSRLRHALAGAWGWAQTRVGRSCPAGRSLARLVDETGDHVGELLNFGQETDREFTHLAGGLCELSSQLARMRDQATALDNILQDRDQDKALASAYALCKSSIELVHASLGTSHALQQRMGEVDAALGQACAAREDFEKNFLLLRTLSMGFRVEASRLDGEFQGVFANVAAAIQEIDRKIVASTGLAFDRMQSLVGDAASERGDIHRGEAALYTEATQSIGLVQRDIDAMREALAPCLEANRRIGGLLTETGPVTASVLRALQYQDIVRQKLEHVATGFRDITEHDHDRVFLHRAAQLQHSHLETARGEIERAGREVTGGLDRLLELGCAIDAQLQTVEKAALAALGRSRMAELFEREILHLARIADTCEEANRRIARLVERIEGVVRVFSEEIASHQREVKLVALNAQVAAARLGSAGALEKLAEETSMVAGRNAATTRQLADLLQATLQRLRSIKVEADEFLGVVTREKQSLETGATEVGAKLVRHRTTIQEQYGAVRAEYSAVHAGTRSLLEEVRFPGLIEGCFDPALALCRDLGACTGDALATGTLSTEGATRFRAHLHRYTMHEERAAHAAVLGEAHERAAIASGTEEVDLFDDAPGAPESEGGSPAYPDRGDEATAPRPGRLPESPRHPPAPPPSRTASATTPNPSPDLGDGIELF